MLYEGMNLSNVLKRNIDNSMISEEIEKIFRHHEQAGEAVKRYFGSMLEANKNEINNILGNFIDEINKKGSYKGTIGGGINTYPFGIESDDLYDEFFGVCTGKTTLNQTLSAAQKWCQKHLNQGADKIKPLSLVIFTEKWDTRTFRKYEDKFIEYLANLNLDIVIVLVTDYGVTEVPLFDVKRMHYGLKQTKEYVIY